ncbi:MAG: glycosyltransferase, partial [Planctomycetes bacterium]|nr:glycosyltransferase [Planctomycetota bacterium]
MEKSETIPNEPAQVDYSVVVPLYNEQDVIEKLYRRITSAMSRLKGHYEIIFVNDGSKDK